MTNTATLINAIKSGSDDAVVEILRNNPQAASGKGPAGESPVLLARYFGKPALAGQIAMLTETDLCESAALGLTARLRTLLELGTNLEETQLRWLDATASRCVFRSCRCGRAPA